MLNQMEPNLAGRYSLTFLFILVELLTITRVYQVQKSLKTPNG